MSSLSGWFVRHETWKAAITLCNCLPDTTKQGELRKDSQRPSDFRTPEPVLCCMLLCTNTVPWTHPLTFVSVMPHGIYGSCLCQLLPELLLLLLPPFCCQVPRWDPEEFMDSLKPGMLHPDLTARLAGSTATTAAALYGAFIASPNFAFWFSQHRKPVLHLVEPEPEQVRAACCVLCVCVCSV